MPTGYTAAIADGISFNDFIMKCARAMGACIMMRDESVDAEIPQKFEPSDYHKKALETTSLELKSLDGMTKKKATELAGQDYKKEVADIQKAIEKKNELKIKYKVMLIQIRGWNPPTPDHVGLKDFMIQQIESSIDYDCDNTFWLKRKPVLLSPQEWIGKKRTALLKNLDYHNEQNLQEIERTESRTAWVKALRKSLE